MPCVQIKGIGAPSVAGGTGAVDPASHLSAVCDGKRNAKILVEGSQVQDLVSHDALC